LGNLVFDSTARKNGVPERLIACNGTINFALPPFRIHNCREISISLKIPNQDPKNCETQWNQPLVKKGCARAPATAFVCNAEIFKVAGSPGIPFERLCTRNTLLVVDSLLTL
jgi:hypothetical protein